MSFLSVVVQAENHQRKGDKMRKAKRSNSKLLKVVDNTAVSVETKKQQDDDKAYSNFNDKCKELIRTEIRSLFEESKVDLGSKVYNFAFHLAQELIFDKMPIGSYQRALNAGTKEAQQNYLEYIGNEYSIKPREITNDEKPKTIN
jgi:type IV secretory pathway VirB4 component